MRIALFLLVVAGLLAAAPVAAHQIACSPASAPLVELNLADAYLGVYDGYAYLLCRDGRITLSITRVGAAPFVPEFTSSVTQGRVPAATLLEVNRALGEARVGALEDCNAGGTVDGIVDLRFTWFGRGRQNTVVIRGAIGEPRCSPEVVALRSALVQLLFPANLEGAETIEIPSSLSGD